MNEWKEWEKKYKKALGEKLPKTKPPKQKESVITRPITDEELFKIKKLQHIRVAWWCGDGRFIEQFINANKETTITERQAFYISVLWYKYRKQLGHNGSRPAGYI